MDEVEFVDVQKICVLQCSALITTYIDMCIYIYFYTDIDTVCMHYIALHICGCLRKRAQNKTGFVLKPGFLYPRTAPKSEETSYIQNVDSQLAQRNQSFSVVTLEARGEDRPQGTFMPGVSQISSCGHPTPRRTRRVTNKNRSESA